MLGDVILGTAVRRIMITSWALIAVFIFLFSSIVLSVEWQDGLVFGMFWPMWVILIVAIVVAIGAAFFIKIVMEVVGHFLDKGGAR